MVVRGGLTSGVVVFSFVTVSFRRRRRWWRLKRARTLTLTLRSGHPGGTSADQTPTEECEIWRGNLAGLEGSARFTSKIWTGPTQILLLNLG